MGEKKTYKSSDLDVILLQHQICYVKRDYTILVICAHKKLCQSRTYPEISVVFFSDSVTSFPFFGLWFFYGTIRIVFVSFFLTVGFIELEL